MSQSIGFLKPTYYIPKEDEQLKAIVQMISDHKQEGGLNGHGLAIAKAVHSIALVIFTNIPYYFTLGSKNLFLNCIHLNLELIVLGHYNAAIQNLIYSVIAVIYVTIGIFIPPVLNGFKMEKSQPDDSNTPPDSSLSIIIEGQEEPEIRSPTPSPEELVGLASNSSTQSGPAATFNGPSCSSSFSNTHSLQGMLTSLSCSSANSVLSVTEDPSELQMRESPKPSTSVSFSSPEAPGSSQQYPSQTNSIEPDFDKSLDTAWEIIPNSEHDSIPSQQHPSQVNSIKISLNSLVSDDWVIPNVQSLEVASIDVHMIEASGVNLENQAHRVALNEYIRILWDDFKIDPSKQLTAIENWLKSPIYKDNLMIKALYCTLCYLTAQPIAYGNESLSYNNAKEQYIAYVSSLWGVFATTEFKAIRKGSNIKELKDCLTLIRALCKARFLSENHGLLRNLLQLHEERYDREHETTETLAVTRKDFAQNVRLKNEKVDESPASMKVSLIQKTLRKFLGAIGYEDFLMTDIPFLRGKQIFKNDEGVKKEFYYMRHPTPHTAGSPLWIALGTISRTFGLHIESGEAIATEFEVMLEAIAEETIEERKGSYLIQSHQRLNDTHIAENESSRSQTLDDLQTSHKNFHVVFQAVEGDLFNRKDSYAEIKTFTDLKKAIKASFCKEGSPNRLPACLEGDEEYRDVIMDQLLDHVHQILFEGRADISFDGQDPTQPGIDYPNREWQAFILAFYILQGDDLKFRLPNVKYFCTNCKNFFDRGGDRAMAEDRLHQEMSEREITSEDLKATLANLIPVPLQSKGQGVIKKRLEPGLALAEILATLSVKDRQRLQGISFQGYKFDRFEVSKREQRAIPLLVEDVQLKKAQTFQEIQEVLKPLQGKSYCIPDNKMVQKNWESYQEKTRDDLFKQVNNDLNRSMVHVNGTLYDAQDPKDAKGIFTLLINYGISEEVALQAMAQMQQGVFAEPTKGLTESFQHDKLGLIVAHSPEKSTIDVLVTKDSVEIKAQNRLLYRTTNSESAYFRESPIAVFNTMVSATIPKDGSAPNAQWTWEVADVPV